MTDRSHIVETMTPTDVAAVADAVRHARERKLAIYPIGGGTTMRDGVATARPGIELIMTGMSRVVDYPTDDMTVTVEAGMTIAALHRELAAQGQRLPVDVPMPDRATVGGAIAIDAFGPRRYAYGAMRDYVLGMTVVDGMGTIFNAGGRVVKNAAGYNMCRLLTGSRGTLGVITQATLMVRPQLETSAFLVCEAPTLAIAEKLLAHLIASPTRPTAVELVAGRPRENDVILGPMLEGNAGRLYVGFEGAAAEVNWMVEQLRGPWTALGAAAPMVIPAQRAETLWRWLTELRGDVALHVLPSDMISTIEKILECEPDCAVHAHAGDGVIWIDAGEREEGREERVNRLRAMVDTARGPEMRLMQAIKERFDPENILP